MKIARSGSSETLEDGGNLQLNAKEWDRLRTRFRLSPRDVNVLGFLLERAPTDKQIAANLHLSVNTIHAHIANLRAAFRATTRVEVVNRALAYLRRPDPAIPRPSGGGGRALASYSCTTKASVGAFHRVRDPA